MAGRYDQVAFQHQAKSRNRDSFNQWRKIAFIESYDAIVSEGYQAIPPPEPARKRGRPKKGRVLNMLDRLSKHRHEVLAFMVDSCIPFDNNQAGRDIHLMKVKQKNLRCFPQCQRRRYVMPNPQLYLHC